MTALQILALLNSFLEIMDSAGVNWAKFMEMRERAKREGRELSRDELESLLDDAQQAIDAL